MSKAETTTATEETFATKAGIEMVTPRVFAELLEINAASHVVVCAIGPSGIGKTAIPKQVAKRRNKGKGVPYVAFHMPTTNFEDFQLPTFSPDTKRYYDKRIPRRFQPLFDWVEKVRKDLKLKPDDPFPRDMSPILAIEELNRAVDKSVSRAAFTLLDDRVIGDEVLDPGIQIVVTMNPSGGGMAVNEFDKDPAMARRLLRIGVTHNYGDFMKYATEAKFHPSVLGHLGAQPSHLYDEQAALNAKAFACPATWEQVSRLCRQFDELNVSLLSPAGRAAVAGAVGTGSAAAFLDFVKDHTLVVTPEDVLSSYGPDSEARRRFKAYITDEGGRLDKVTDLVMGISVRIFANLDRKIETILKPLAYFYADLPEEIMMSFIQRKVEEANRIGNDAKTYLQTLNQKLASEPVFNEALKRLHHAKMAGQKEQ